MYEGGGRQKEGKSVIECSYYGAERKEEVYYETEQREEEVNYGIERGGSMYYGTSVLSF